MADQPASLAEALAELQRDLPPITKDATAQYGKYADLADITRQLMPRLGELGLSFTARPTITDRGFVLAYELRHTSDDVGIGGEYPLPGMEKGPQALGSAITYARRYSLCAVTGVAPDDDDDDGAEAEKATPQRAKVKPPGPEHERLRHGTVVRTPDDQIADRGPVPPADDLWAGQPAGQPYEPEKRTGTIDGRQRSQIFAKFKILGVADAGTQRSILTQILGREVSSRATLSATEADDAIKDLQARVDAKDAAEEAARAAAEQDAAAEEAATP